MSTIGKFALVCSEKNSSHGRLSLNLLNHNFPNTLADSNDHVAVSLNVKLSDPPSGDDGLGFEYCMEAVVFADYDADRM